MYDLSDSALADRLGRLQALRDKLDAMRPLDPDALGRAMQRLRLEWTYHSNAIEGNSLTYGETRALLLHGVTAQGKPLKDHLDIKGHREALDALERFVRDEEPLTLAAIREMHRVLLGEPYQDWAQTADGERTRRTITPGEFKTQPNHVVTETGETHYYARPEETPARMHELVDWFRETWPPVGEADAVAVAADLHHRFAAVHPFDDGNGRMARLLMNVVLMRAGYPPAVIRQENRSAYYGALAAADGGELGPFVRFVADELAATLELYLRALRGEPDPDAFGRRAALLRREVEAAVASHSREAADLADRVASVSAEYVAPFLSRIDDGVQKLAPLFARFGRTFSYETRAGLRKTTGAGMQRALTEDDWVRFDRRLSLGGFVRDPGKSVACHVEGEAGPDRIVLACMGWSREIGGAAVPSQDEALADADEVLGRVLAEVERFQREA